MSAGVVVVGGGPAGLAAALEAARAGARTVLVDERSELGGQYYKQLPGGWAWSRPDPLGRQYDEGRELIAEVRRAGVEVHTGTLVWNLFDDRRLALTDDAAIWQLPFAKLILATGAWELPVALPGWTLPGVLTGGGAQSLMAGQGMLPGRRVLLAGVGPFQLRVAAQLIEAGAEVVGILDASDVAAWIRAGVRLLPHWPLVREALDYMRRLRRSGVRIYRAHLPVRALGGGRVERVVASRVDGQWRPVSGTDVTFEVDALCVTYGFIPSVELARLAGCRLDRGPGEAVATTWHDAGQATSVPDVFVAGEAGNIEGAAVALAEGRLAGLEAARQLGVPEGGRYQERRTALARDLTEARARAGALRGLTTLRPGLFELMTDDTVVCRCEDVSAGEIRAAAVRWEPGPRGVKYWTRAGMGRCQSRVCGHLVARLIAGSAGVPVDAIAPDTPRPPVRPVPLAAMASPREAGEAVLGAWHDERRR